MTRYNLLRLAQVSAAALAAGVLSAALAQATWAGLASTVRLLAVLGACGVVVSAGWHGTAVAVERHEERKRDARRHRVPRSDRGTPRPPAMAPRPASTGAAEVAAEIQAEAETLRDWDFGVDAPRPPGALRQSMTAGGGPYPNPYAAADAAAGRPEFGTSDDRYEDLYAHRSAGPA